MEGSRLNGGSERGGGRAGKPRGQKQVKPIQGRDVEGHVGV